MVNSSPAVHPNHRDFHARRRGFTLIELLVVISILAVLMALILPAVMTARTAAQRAQCQNNLRNVGLAMINVAQTKGRFPASGSIGTSNGTFAPYHSWVVELLPWVERNDLATKWDFNSPSNVGGNKTLAELHLAVVRCPTDISAFGKGDLSYVVNGGFGWTTVLSGVSDCPAAPPGAMPLDLNGNGLGCPADPADDGRPADKELYFQTAFFFLENWKVPGGTDRHHTLNDITDGLSQTIMIAENVRAGFDPLTRDTNWANPFAARNSFFVSFGVCLGGKCAPGNVDYRRANVPPESINGSLDKAEGEAPWPSSFHDGGVFAVFGDGHVKFLSQLIDGRVYAALVSPQGGRIQGPLAQQPVSDGDY